MLSLRHIPHLVRTATLLVCVGCASVPPGRIAVDSIEFRGNEELDDDELEDKIATRETKRFLGVVRGVLYDYELFNRYVLERDLQRIERYYRARGYYEARAKAGRVYSTGRGHVRVEIVIHEGEPVLLRRVDIHGIEDLSPELAAAARSGVKAALPIGEPFTEQSLSDAAERLRGVLTDSGYARVAVKHAADVDLPRHAAAVGFWVEPGRVVRYGTVSIAGLDGIPEAPVRRALDLTPGDPYSSSELAEAEQALLNLGVFSSVVIEPDLEAGAETSDTVPIRVRVQPTKLRSVHVGGGVQADVIKTDVHLTAGWESRNFLGGLRKLKLELTPGVVLYPTRLPTLEPPERLLPQVRARSELRQPGLFEARMSGFVRTEGSIYPVLLSPDQDTSAPILGYRDVRIAVGVDRSLWRLHGELTHNVQINSPFTYLGILDSDLHTILISYPELGTRLDLRDDRVHPHAGLYLANSLQVAGAGGDARDLRVQPEARVYVPLGRHLTLAMRGSVGMLFPDNYGETLVPNALSGTPGGQSRADWVRDVQLLFLRGFFAGGTGSNRGYGAREIGPHGVVPFYNPGQSSGALAVTCDPASPDYTAASCDLPLGGLSLWEASLELRYPIALPLQGALFADSADVSPYEVNFRFNRPHLSLGLGFRYDTPVGPIRLDAGYRVPGLQAPDSEDEVKQPSETFGLPIALSFGIGEAF